MDSMTGLGNRAAWEVMLAVAHARAERYDEPAVILLLDLDGLKAINDRDGHLIGDLAIRLTADVLVRVTRRPDRVARLGGDEFGVIAQPCTDDNADALVARIQATMTEEGIEASVGSAAHDPSEPILQTWQRADARMYATKERRRGLR
jgi:diguanylate cyclase (GGDEF)-like protein